MGYFCYRHTLNKTLPTAKKSCQLIEEHKKAGDTEIPESIFPVWLTRSLSIRTYKQKNIFLLETYVAWEWTSNPHGALISVGKTWTVGKRTLSQIDRYARVLSFQKIGLIIRKWFVRKLRYIGENSRKMMGCCSGQILRELLDTRFFKRKWSTWDTNSGFSRIL